VTLRERIQEIDRQADPDKIRRFLDSLKAGAVKFGGRPVIFTYVDTVELFARQGIDASRFEELCHMADYSQW